MEEAKNTPSPNKRTNMSILENNTETENLNNDLPSSSRLNYLRRTDSLKNELVKVADMHDAIKLRGNQGTPDGVGPFEDRMNPNESDIPIVVPSQKELITDQTQKTLQSDKFSDNMPQTLEKSNPKADELQHKSGDETVGGLTN